ncbi:MAG: ABC transporter permease [Bryobacteraceae bacterium]
MRGLALIDNAGQDLRYTIRQLQNSPGFTCSAIFVLALGISASVAIFSLVDAALIKPLPYRDPSRLVSVFETNPTGLRYPVSYPDYQDWKHFNKVFSSIDAYDVSGGFTLSTPSGPQMVAGTRVSAGFFHTLGIVPVLGRDFHSGEDLPAAPRTVLISYAAWQERFGGRRDVLGQSVTLNGSPNLIIGVLPRDFHFAPAGNVEFWGTLRDTGATFAETNPCEKRRDCHSLNTVARLKDGISLQTALAAMTSIAQQLQRQYPATNRDQGANVLALSDVIVGDIRPVLLALLGAACLLLLIACVNVSSLLLARSDRRQREIAVRGALGASSARLFRQFVTEGMVLAAVGGLFGLISSIWLTQFLVSLIPAGMLDSMPYAHERGLNSHVVAFSLVISLIASLLFAIIPIFRLSPSKTMEGLKDGSRTSAGIMWRRFGANLIVLELAIAMVLLVCAGLLSQSLYRLLHESIGFETDHLATPQIEGPASRYSVNKQFIALERQIVDRIAEMPGVKSVGVSNGLPVGWVATVRFQMMGRPWHGEHNEAIQRRVSSSYLTTLQARLLRGRYFDETEDRWKPPVAIINQTMAKQYFPAEDPIGKQILISTPPQPPMQIVGVVDDVKEGPLDTAARPALYTSFNQGASRFFSIAVRTSQREQSLLPALAAAIHHVDPGILIHDDVTMAQRIGDSPPANLHRSSAWLVAGFAAIAFLLSVAGVYGVVAYSVSQRTREIGIRIALGAQPKSIHQLILCEAAWLIAGGTALGVVLSLVAANLIHGLLFGVRSWDAVTFAAVAAVVAMSALLATYIPTRRAASINPVETLRAE